jgi:class 3 adenylate cyclase
MSAGRQRRPLKRRNADLLLTKRLEYRIGINVGDVVAEGDDFLGEGINISARLEESADPAGISVGGSVREQITGHPELGLGTKFPRHTALADHFFALRFDVRMWRKADIDDVSPHVRF